MTAEEYLRDHGIEQKTIEYFGLTWNSSRITIPVHDSGTFLYNKYRLLNNDEQKYSFDKGSHATLFNIESIEGQEYVFITEGEMDTMRLWQENICAISSTSGAATWKPEWTELLKDKKIYIVYDSDAAGRAGAAKLLKDLPGAINIELPKETKDICEFFKSYDKEAFKELVEKQSQKETITYEQLCAVVDKWLLLPDKNVLKIVLATLIAHHFDSDPLWMFLVAPPSGSKTEIISTVSEIPFIYMLSDLTAQTFASGLNAKVDPSLLLKLENNVLVMKDFTTVLNMRREDRGMILSQLREIYDGKYSKEFGTGKRIDWQGRLTLLAGVTPIIDTHSSVFQVMGERFVMYRIPQAKDTDVARKALSTLGYEKDMRKEMAEAMLKYFYSIIIPKASEIIIPEEIIDALSSLTSYIVKGRSAVLRDQMRREIEYIPAPEAPARLAKQLGTLIRALAVLDGRKDVEWKDYYLTLRVAIDIIPTNRTAHLLALCDNDGMISTTQVAQKTGFSKGGSENILEDLTSLGIATVKRQGSGNPNLWEISDEARQYFVKILPKALEGLWEAFDSSYPNLLLIHEILKGLPTTDIEVPLEFDL
jgi:5S rRNA maturation endonuclease (ribonuclease M5)